MCDALQMVSSKIKSIENEPYYFVTLHRPYNTDEKGRLQYVLKELNGLDHKVIFPIHPRTVNKMASFGMKKEDYPNIQIIPPIGYIESLSYQKFAMAIITDSGGMQKEAYMLKKKCITIRTETEWTETLLGGWNSLIFGDLSILSKVLQESTYQYIEGVYGDGKAAYEITNIIKSHI